MEVKVPGTKTARPLGVSGRNPVVDHSPGQDECQDRHQCNPSPTAMQNGRLWVTSTHLGNLPQLRNHDFLCMTATPRNTATNPTTRLSQCSSFGSRPDWLCGSLASHTTPGGIPSSIRESSLTRPKVCHVGRPRRQDQHRDHGGHGNVTPQTGSIRRWQGWERARGV